MSLPSHGYALRGSSNRSSSKQRTTSDTFKLGSLLIRRRWVDLIIDSGCTWHVHNRLDELINTKPCNDVVEDAAGNRATCLKKGDLPLIFRGSNGTEFKFLLRDVRWAPSFPDSLVSVDQLWETSRVDCVFRDRRHLSFTLNDDARGGPLTAPFARRGGLYRWSVAIARSDEPSSPPRLFHARKLRDGLHAAGSTAHLSALPADTLAAMLHRRLHVGLQHIRQLGTLSSDAPAHVERAANLVCPHCAEANSTRLPHKQSRYEPTHAGRLVHVDIAGPFLPSTHGGYRYCLLLVDDHSRFKFAYFLHQRSDARAKIQKFVAEFNALASQHSDTPISGVGKLRSDNAGEFVAREFTELLDQLTVGRENSPPHVHQLNGVAERAIRSTFCLVRSYLTSSGLSPGFWPHAVEMAIDVLNRTSGPESSQGGRTSYEMLTGRPPRVLGIMPFGCRAFAVKPREQYSKTTIDPRAWVGVNLGRCPRTPSAFKIWCPAAGRIVVTSDVYFMEHLYPCRPKGFQIDSEVNAVPIRAPSHSPNDCQTDAKLIKADPPALLNTRESETPGGPTMATL